MTTNTISPTLTLAALPLGGAPALATPPSGELAVPPDFAVALAELVAAPVETMPRLPLAAPGNALPVKLADANAATLAGALPDEELPTLPESGDPQPVVVKSGDAADEDATRDPALDPALSWLIAPPPVAIVAASVAVPVPAAPDAVEVANAVATQPMLAASIVEPAGSEIVAAKSPAAILVEADLSDRIPTPLEPSPRASRPLAEPANVIPNRIAATARPAQEIDPKLAKVITDAPVVTGARPLPLAPPRFVETRITPTFVAAPVVAATPVETPVTEVPVTIPASPPEKAATLSPDKALEIPTAAPTAQPVAPSPQLAAPALAALASRPSPRPIELRPLAETTASLFAAALTHAATAPTAVQPTVDTQSQGMDLTRDTGLERMIDRIEMLRDDADSRDTRIRLVPDALGPVEVSVRRDGDAVRVHFTADQPATRALIADAQPRLNELAEARGIKISQASVDTGTASDGRARPQPQQASQPPAAPRRARTETTDSGDERIA